MTAKETLVLFHVVIISLAVIAIAFHAVLFAVDIADRRREKRRKEKERATTGRRRFFRVLQIARAARNRGEVRGVAKEKERMGERAKWLDSVLAGRVAQINAEGRIVGAEAN